ncbi:hypothetical protein GF377_02330 [candidate division GN15 bacterium]|nr:hypothetical protein [candidate division GN15 bacterium]
MNIPRSYRLSRVRTGLATAGLLLALGSLGGCGVYTLNPRGQSTVSTMYVAPFDNETAEYGLADRLTEIIIDAFIADGSIRVVAESEAEAVLLGTLTNYERQVQKYDQNDQVETYKIVMDFDIVLRNAEDQSDIWKENLRQEGLYDAVEETEEDGQRRAGGWLVEAVLNRTTKSW